MSRYRLTFAVALTLSASYQLYAQWADSFTRKSSEGRPLEVAEPVAPPPETTVAVARQYLPDLEWAQHPDYTFQRDNRLFVFAGTAQLNRDADNDPDDPAAGRQLRFEPFALVRIDPKRPEAPPLVVTCEVARVQFENPVEIGFDAASPGRVTNAWFDGVVDITGPDGLRIQGQNFSFTEQTLNLYSPYPVAFAFGPTAENSACVRGGAGELNVDFSQNTDPDLDPAVPRIGGVHVVQLRNQVVLDCDYEERRGQEEPRPASAHIRCDLSLQFNAETRLATLLKNVSVHHPTGDEQHPDEADTLHCHQLDLGFVELESPDASQAKRPTDASRSPETTAPALSAAAAARNPFSNLRVQWVEARSFDRGDFVRLHSDSQHTTALARLLRYEVDSGAAVLTDMQSAAAGDAAAPVQVERDGTRLESQMLHVTPDPESDARIITCLGRGRLQHPDPDTGELLLEATWSERLNAAPDSDTGLLLVQLDQDARLIFPQGAQHPDQRAGIRADHLNIWVDETAAQQQRQDQPTSAVAAVPGPGGLVTASQQQFPVRFFEARGGVIVASPQLRAETERLRAVIEPGRLRYESAPDAQQTGHDEPQSSGLQSAWQLTAQEVFLKLKKPPTSEIQIAEADVEGNAVISQAAVPAESAAEPDPGPMSLAGAHVELVNEGGAHQIIMVTGSPALLRRGKYLLECGQLQLDRAGNRAIVFGAGLLQAPVDRDLNGQDLSEPMILDVKWEEGLTFDGELAAFRKAVKLQLHDSVLQCDEMDVRLSEPLKFSDDHFDAKTVPLRDVHCRNGVNVEIYDWQDNRIVGIRKARLTQFFLDYVSGGFQGDGPGKINHWALRTGRRIAIANRQTAQANTAVESDPLEWEHVSVEFDDLLLGNFKDRTAELHGRVRSIYAPVRRISETFTRDDLSGNSPSVEHAVWLGSDVMNIEVHPETITAPDGKARSENKLVIVGEGRCELEGQKFYAKADRLSYDEAKTLFTLRGKGNHEASIYHQEPGAEPRRVAGQIIQFTPSEEQKFRIEGSRGFQGVQ
ncbi:MAG: hypothetical protein U0992_07165 [Planctomycetaceae bacterium]